MPFGPTLARMEKWGPRGKPGYPGHQNRPVRQVSGPRMTAKHYRVSSGPLYMHDYNVHNVMYMTLYMYARAGDT